MINTEILKKHFKSSWIYCAFSFSFPAIITFIIGLSLARNSSSSIPLYMISYQIGLQIGWIIPVIYSIVTSNRILVGEIQSGSITYVVASPVKRRTIISTKIFFMLIAQIYSFLLNTILMSIIYCIYKKNLDSSLGALIYNQCGLTLLIFSLSSISFFFATYHNKVLLSHVCGTVIIFVFYILYIISSIASQIDSIKEFANLKYLTIMSFYSQAGQVKTSGVKTVANIDVKSIMFYLSMLLIGASLYVSSGFVFCKKDLPL